MRKNRTKRGRSKEDCKESVSVEAFEIFGQRRDLESDEDLSWEDPLEEFESWLST